MKNTVKMLMSIVLSVSYIGPAYSDSPKIADDHLTMAVVLDCSDVGNVTWKQSLILVRQAISLLREGDELMLVTARCGQNIIEINSLIDANNAAQQIRLNQKLMSLTYKWWCRANLGDALELTYDELGKHSKYNKCCLLITDGEYSDSDITSIRYKAGFFKRASIPLIAAVSSSANQNLLLAGDLGELEIAVIDQVNLTSWVERICPRNIVMSRKTTVMAPAATPIVTVPPPSVEQKPAPAVATPDKQPDSSQAPLPIPLFDANRPGMMPPDQITISPSAPGSQSGSGNIDANMSGVSDKTITSDTNLPSGQPESKDKSDKNTSDHSVAPVWFIHLKQWLWLYCVIVLFFFLLFFRRALLSIMAAIWSSKPQQPKTQDNTTYDIVATYRETPYNLGEESTIRSLTFGSSPASPVPIGEEGSIPGEFILKRTRTQFGVRNISKDGIRVNGILIKPGKSIDIIFPVAIESDHGWCIVINREPLQLLTNKNKESQI